MKTIQAVYEDGVFKPTEPVNLPEHSLVKIEIGQGAIASNGQTAERDPSLDRIYSILSERYDSGDPHGSERHDEHQP